MKRAMINLIHKVESRVLGIGDSDSYRNHVAIKKQL